MLLQPHYNNYPWAQPTSSDEHYADTTGLSIACMALTYPNFRRAAHALEGRHRGMKMRKISAMLSARDQQRGRGSTGAMSP
jgi:hypothetical protein